MTRRHAIESDNVLNDALKEEVQTLRGDIMDCAEKKNPLPEGFEAVPCKNDPSVMIKYNGRESQVPIFAYGEVRQTLNDLFGGE
jgi:hypothetical protein